MPPRPFQFLIGPLLAIVCMTAAANPLGRLFHTPSERAALDQLRQGSTPDKAPEVVEQISIDGVVKRSNGKSTTWINGIPQQDNEHAQGVLVLGKPAAYGSAALQLPSGKSVNLKAGQTYDVASGKIQEGFGIPSSQIHIMPTRNIKPNAKAATKPAHPEEKP